MAYSLENTQDLTDLADAIRSKTGDSDTLTVPQMIDAVEGLDVLAEKTITPLTNTGTGMWLATLLLAYPELSTKIKQFNIPNNQTNTQLLAHIDNTNMSALPKIVIESGANINMNQLVAYNQFVQYINIEYGGENNTTFSVSNMRQIFRECFNLREVDVSFFQYCGSVSNMQSGEMFNGCYRLRNITGLQHLPVMSQSSAVSNVQYSIYYNLFNACYSLNSIENLPVQHITYTVNCMSNTFNYNFLLKKLTFKTNNGIPDTANWSKTTIDLTTVGYWSNIWVSPTTYGFSAEKEITDSTSYNLLKNDPDAWTKDINYSKYNHDSAVETINSLPDVSQGSNNLIIFYGDCGTYTDGGPISDLTAAEIQVATDKGWTISIQ